MQFSLILKISEISKIMPAEKVGDAFTTVATPLEEHQYWTTLVFHFLLFKKKSQIKTNDYYFELETNKISKIT